MNGTICNGDADDPTTNLWATEIQSVLRWGADGNRKTLYLNHECRNESIPFSADIDPVEPGIFMRNRPEEFLTYSDGNRFVQLECPERVYPASLGVPRNTSKPFPLIHERPLTIPTPSRVDCAERPVSSFAHADLVGGLQNGEIPVRSLFLKVAWRHRHRDYELFAPCRYVNFSPKGAKGDYLQPISGVVLIEMHGHLFPAYVACAWGQKGTVKIEFATARYHNAHKIMTAHFGFQGDMEKTIEKVFTFVPSFLRKWDGVLEVDGEFSLYQYG